MPGIDSSKCRQCQTTSISWYLQCHHQLTNLSHICTDAHAPTYTCTHAHICMPGCMCTCTHTYTHTHTHTHARTIIATKSTAIQKLLGKCVFCRTGWNSFSTPHYGTSIITVSICIFSKVMEIVARVLVCYPSLVVVVGHQKSTSSGMSGTDHASNAKNTILLAACGNNELLPQNPELPADLFTSCLTTPIRMALRWWVLLIILYTYSPEGHFHCTVKP